MIASLDESVGRLAQALEQFNLTTNTVVFFASDNGGVGGYVDPDNSSRRIGVTDNAPLRGGKGMLYEGGIRVPLLAQWPGVVQPGSRTTQPCLHVDLFPTLCEIAGTRPPRGHVLDGVSLVPLLRDAGAHLGRDAIYWHFPAYLEAFGRSGWRTTPAGAVRAGNFKLIQFFEDGRLELYNVVEDVGEKNNLVRSLPEKAKELQDKLATWRKDLGAPMPTPKSAPSPQGQRSP
jgi:arylsulfatase A-like enzyme